MQDSVATTEDGKTQDINDSKRQKEQYTQNRITVYRAFSCHFVNTAERFVIGDDKSFTSEPQLQSGAPSVPVLRQSPRSPAESVLNDKVLITSRVPQLANCPPAHPLSDWPGRRKPNATKGPSRTFLEGAPPSATAPTPAVSGT